MDIRRIIPLLCLLSVFTWGGIKLKRSFTKVMAIDVTQRDETLNNLPSTVSRDGFAQYLRVAVPLPESLEANGIKKECESYTRSLMSLNLILFKAENFPVTSQQLNEPNSACPLSDDIASAAETNYLKECFLNNPSKTESLNDDCVHSIFRFRAILTDLFYRAKKISDLDSLPILTNLLYAEVLGLKRTPEQPMDYRKTQNLIDQIIEIKPNLKAALKIKFYLEIRAAAALAPSKTLKEQDEIWDDIKKSFQKAKSQSEIQDNVQEYQAWIDTRGYDPSLTLKLANTMLSQNPNSPWALFLSAYGHWLNDEHEESFRDLRKAIDLDPKNESYQKSLSLLMNSGAGNESFNPGLKLGISSQDFDK